MIPMRIRKADSTDEPQWIEMRKALWPDCAKDRHSLEVEQLLQSEGIVLLAEDSEGRVVGFAEVSIRRDHVEGTSSAPVPNWPLSDLTSAGTIPLVYGDGPE
jgi:aminoglycoside 6'-N-acetyltransferase I